MRYFFVSMKINIALRIVVLFSTGIARTQKTFRQSIGTLVSFHGLAEILYLTNV